MNFEPSSTGGGDEAASAAVSFDNKVDKDSCRVELAAVYALHKKCKFKAPYDMDRYASYLVSTGGMLEAVVVMVNDSTLPLESSVDHAAYAMLFILHLY